jgi:hypothetical protein
MSFCYEKSIGVAGGHGYVRIEGVKRGCLAEYGSGIMAEMDYFRSGKCLVYLMKTVYNQETTVKNDEENAQ